MADGGTGPIAVIGAGIVGVACALHLQRAGRDVVLIDKGEPGEGASFGNAGVLARCSVVPVATPGIMTKAPGMLFGADGPLFLKWSYVPRLLPWLIPYLRAAKRETVEHTARHLAPLVVDSLDEHQDLARGTGAEKWIRPSPYLFLYRDRAAFDGDAFGWGLRRAHGFTWEILEGAAVRDFDPALSPDYGCAVMLQDHAYIGDPGRYVKDLAAAVVAGGGSVRRAAVRDVTPGADGVTLDTDTGPVTAAAAVLAAGAWSGPLARRFGANVPLESERGYHLELTGPSARPRVPVMDAARKFVATPVDAGLRLAGIVEFGGLDAPPSAAPVALLQRGARALLPGLTYEQEKSWLGHRPAPADSLPVIGRSPLCDKVFFAYGHHHVGLTAGPKTGRLVAQLVAGLRLNLDLGAYRPDRFGQGA
ncbi:MAG: FAD-binding oxidoreductase [Hyphomicrobiales bacterium]|nr:FAD-binding oxidoreductase [Hyphomicrobiales bacterium]